MSASGWLIMAVRTCSPFQRENKCSHCPLFSSVPRATSLPAWSQYLNHRGGTLGSQDVQTHCNLLQTWWHEQKRQVQQNCMAGFIGFCASFLFFPVNSWGSWHRGSCNWWKVNESSYNEIRPFETQDKGQRCSLWLMSHLFCLKLLYLVNSYMVVNSWSSSEKTVRKSRASNIESPKEESVSSA